MNEVVWQLPVMVTKGKSVHKNLSRVHLTAFMFEKNTQIENV